MTLNFRFAIVSDLHIGLPHTISTAPHRFHLVEVSIPAFEIVLAHLTQLNLDFLLIPGDLTQHGEPDNHTWLSDRLSKLPFPVYVIPGNHDIPVTLADNHSISWADFPKYYRKFGYENPYQHYYTRQLLPGVRLIALNSNQINHQDTQIGRLDDEQLEWLKATLTTIKNELVLVMIHHNIIEHLPEQSQHPLGRRYMLENAPILLEILRSAGVKLIFTGHLHVQDIAEDKGIYDITTGSLVSYPHPYRILEYNTDKSGKQSLQIESHRVESVPNFPNLPYQSREWMGDRSLPFMLKLLSDPALNISQKEAEKLAPSLRYFWADIAQGDTIFDFPHFPKVAQDYFKKFSAIAPDGTPKPIDNQTILEIL